MRVLLLPILCAPLLLAACTSSVASMPERIDLAAEALPVSIAPIRVPETLPGAPALSVATQLDLALRRAFFARRFSPMDAMLAEARETGLAEGEEDHALRRFIEGVRDTQLAGLDACNAWLETMPESYVAHLVCGAMWGSAAWDARGDDTVDKVTPARFALMRERFERANVLLTKALGLTPRPVEALTILAANHFGMGGPDNRAAALALLRRAQEMAPAYSSIHEVRINFLLPEWGGSSEMVIKAIEEAARAGVARDRLRDFHDEFVVRPWTRSDPGAERAYWDGAIATEPSFYRLDSLVKYFHRVENWRDGEPAASRLIAAYPDYAHGYWLRAVIREKLGRIPEALEDYRAAAARGDDWATQALIQAYIQGGLGLPQRDWQALDQLCRYGAGLGISSAANCLGAAFREAASIGPPFRTDIPQSLAWHLLAARAGYHNSQYDLGWLLMTGRVPGMDEKQGKRLGVFWLRRAAELGHQFARKKLQEGGYPESEPVGGPPSVLEAARDGVLRILSGGM